MSAQDATPELPAAPEPEAARCANCGAVLHGHYCHACGQSVHNPVQGFRHALEDVFESFWHLDGRIFRTLRDLAFPGLVANRYLAGHRVDYVAPLRLFVVLAVISFLFAEIAAQASMQREPVIVTNVQMDSAGTAAATGTPDDAAWTAYREVDVGWLPGFADRWVARKWQQMRENQARIKADPDLLLHAFMSTVPKALFVLVPLFALLLKLAYLRTGRLYLEHLVVALYSHAWICVTVLVVSLVSVGASWTAAGWLGWTASKINQLLLLAIPAYLLVMQRRVYRQGWGRTLARFTVLGSVYALVVGASAVALILLSVANA